MKIILITLAVFLMYHINMSSPSITGVTYMDHFDFESRYRNVYECDPFYYHPLHLPEKCASMYEQLIRSRISRNGPAQIFKERSKEEDPCSEETAENDCVESKNQVYQINYKVPDIQQNVYMYNYQKQYPQPYDGLLQVLEKEAIKSPVAPTFAVLPYIGPVALYRQPVGKEVGKLVEKWSRRYTHTDDETNRESVKYYGRITKDMKLRGTNPFAEIMKNDRKMTPDSVKFKKL